MAARVPASRTITQALRLPSSARSFSTTPIAAKIVTRDNNRHRGVSVLRRSGLREPVSVSEEPLPVPSDYKPEVEVDPKHGLWGFFPEVGVLMRTPMADTKFGRPWTVEELRKKDWDDLHKLWWVCLKERNLIATAQLERMRANMGFGHAESRARDAAVRTTMKRIKATLTERYYLWEDARELAEHDPEINLSGTGQLFNPSDIPDPNVFADDVPVPEVQKEAPVETPKA